MSILTNLTRMRLTRSAKLSFLKMNLTSISPIPIAKVWGFMSTSLFAGTFAVFVPIAR